MHPLGAKVLVPLPRCKRVLAKLHEGHPGISKMKGLECMHACVVARYGQRDRERSSQLPQMPGAATISTTFTDATMELA